MNRTVRGLVAAGCAVAGLVASSTSASAYTDTWDWRATQYESFAIGKINTEVGTNGRYERLTVWDDYADGHSAVLKWHDVYGNGGRVWDHSGSADSTPGVARINIPEGQRIWVRLCIGEWGSKKILDCDPDGWDIHYA